jgi:hypothetical protein
VIDDEEVPAEAWADFADDFWYRLVNHGKRRPQPR